MDRAHRINAIFLATQEAEERILRQQERVASLDARGLHGAAACARETLIVMADRLLTLCATHETMVNTAERVEKSRQAMLQRGGVPS